MEKNVINWCRGMNGRLEKGTCIVINCGSHIIVLWPSQAEAAPSASLLVTSSCWESPLFCYIWMWEPPYHWERLTERQRNPGSELVRRMLPLQPALRARWNRVWKSAGGCVILVINTSCFQLSEYASGGQRYPSMFILRNVPYLLWDWVSQWLGTEQLFLTCLFASSR